MHKAILKRIALVGIAIVLALSSYFGYAIFASPKIQVGNGFLSMGIYKALADTLTKSPTTNNGGSWTNPNNAHADNGVYANITAGSPSGSTVWGNYGFSLTGATITGVRVRYDAWSVGSVQSVTRQATSDLSNTGGFTTAPLFSKINDSNDATMIVGVTNGGGRATFGFTAFTVPTGSTIQDITIHYRHRSTTTSNAYAHGSAIKVGSTYYSMKDTAGWDTGHTTGVASGSPIEDHTYIGTTDPSTGASWNVTAVNSLTEFGVASTDFVPDANFYQVDITVNYTEYNDQIKVDVSWNGGGTWSSTQNTTLTNIEATTWYDVTGVTAWTPAKLVDGQLQVRALAQSVNNAEVVRLDWIPVEVTYTPETPNISNAPASKAFNVVQPSSTYYAKGSAPSNPVQDGECTFTLNNDGTAAVKINIHGHNATGGVGWTLTSGAPGSNSYRLTAYQTGTNPASGIVLTTSDQQFIASIAGSSHTHWDFKMETGTFTDGVEKTYIITLTGVTP